MLFDLNEAAQRLTEFCKENTLVIATPSSSNTREDSTHGHHQMVNNEIRLIIFFAAKDGEGLYSQQKQDQDTFTFMHWRRKWQPTPVFLPGESQGRGSLVGHLWGHRESDTTEETEQQQQQHMSTYVLISYVGSDLSHIAATEVPIVVATPELRRERTCELQRAGLKASRMEQCWQALEKVLFMPPCTCAIGLALLLIKVRSESSG